MRLSIVCVGQDRGTEEGALCDTYLKRAAATGRNLGFAAIGRDEVAISRAHESDRRKAEEAERIASRIRDGAHITLLEPGGAGMSSTDFARMLGSLKDAGTRELCFVIGGPDGLAPLPGKKPGRSLSFGPQTWPHLLVRAMLAEQIYRALAILAGHPYHRG